MLNLFTKSFEEKNFIGYSEQLLKALETYAEIESDLEDAIETLAIHNEIVEETILGWKVNSTEELLELKEFTMFAMERHEEIVTEIKELIAYKEMFKNVLGLMGVEIEDDFDDEE